jgi:enolase-phosphatase E1
MLNRNAIQNVAGALYGQCADGAPNRQSFDLLQHEKCVVDAESWTASQTFIGNLDCGAVFLSRLLTGDRGASMAKSIRAVLLDIEGTTSSLSFVHDVMFPYVREHLVEYLETNWGTKELTATLELLAADAKQIDATVWLGSSHEEQQQQQQAVARQVLAWMDQDLKATGLKQLQGQIWRAGFESGNLVAQVWPDVPAALRCWRDLGVDLRIYSSGSIAAQKLFFGHTESGDLLGLFSGHYDTTTGGKKSAASYAAIAADWGRSCHEILFVSDVVEELQAAAEAGFQVLLSVRPGNAVQSLEFPCLQVHHFAAITPWLDGARR